MRFSCFIFTTIILFSLNACKKNQVETPPPSAVKPNIILIIGDDVGYEIPTCNGGLSYSTPNIDRLANEGMRFTQCHSSPLCSPSRFMLLTGKYNFRNYTTWGQMDLNQRTIGNMLQNAGYATCYAGKWQLDGGDKSISTFGFDKYSVWLPYFKCLGSEEGYRYKSASIYESGNYLPDSLTINRYSEDHFTDYVLNFIKSNKSNPFFVYYAMILCHRDFSPTPESPDYNNWDATPGNSDRKYFPSMVEYMDKKVGLITDQINSLGIANNTVIIYVGDNGTPKQITSIFGNDSIKGGKGQTIEYGVHVPLVCKWPLVIQAGKVNNDLIDFTDFLPTFADIAGINKPSNYGVLDGNSFYNALTGNNTNARKWVFCHFDSQDACSDSSVVKRFSQDTAYKLYETGEFFHYSKDIKETAPLSKGQLTDEEKQAKQKLQDVLDVMHN